MQIWKTVSYVSGLTIAIPTLMAGLFALDERPMLGTFMLLAAMALLLAVLSELCRTERGIQEADFEEKH
jgi:hypothetical protein